MLALALAAAYAAGAAQVYRWEERAHAATLASIKATGDEQNARTAAQVARQKGITADVARAFDSDVRAINARYARRLRSATAACPRKLPAIPDAAALAHGAPADPVPARSRPLEKDCTITTAQLARLQQWIAQQGASHGPQNLPAH